MGPLTSARARAVLDRLYAEDARQRAAGLPPSERTRNIDRESGRFLALVAAGTGAQEVFEAGSSNGVSTIWLAGGAALNGGSVTGSEIIPGRAAAANANLAEAGLAGNARVLAGDAMALLREFGRAIDLLFIDAEKDEYSDLFAAGVGLVRPGGVILADNVVSHDCSAFQRMIRERDDVESVTLPIERGIEWIVKLR